MCRGIIYNHGLTCWSLELFPSLYYVRGERMLLKAPISYLCLIIIYTLLSTFLARLDRYSHDNGADSEEGAETESISGSSTFGSFSSFSPRYHHRISISFSPENSNNLSVSGRFLVFSNGGIWLCIEIIILVIANWTCLIIHYNIWINLVFFNVMTSLSMKNYL